jgi:uracil-DNA glycosylase
MAKGDDRAFSALLAEVRSCRICAAALPLGPRPVLKVERCARLLIVGQAPGTSVHATGIPWNDPSGDRLREWLGLDRERFYADARIAILPAGLCYPGRGPQGDAPPRPECAPRWHPPITAALGELELILLVGRYAQDYYLGKRPSVTETVRGFKALAPRYLPLPHPSPRNNRWLANNPWFARRVLPALRRRLAPLLA